MRGRRRGARVDDCDALLLTSCPAANLLPCAHAAPPLAYAWLHPQGCAHFALARSNRHTLLVLVAGHLRTEWHAHHNAIFDLVWVPGKQRIITASGDQTCRLCECRLTSLLVLAPALALTATLTLPLTANVALTLHQSTRDRTRSFASSVVGTTAP